MRRRCRTGGAARTRRSCTSRSAASPRSIGYFPGVYRAAIESLAPLPVRVLVTTGRDADPSDLGPLPPHVHAERWVAQHDVMPHAAAMACHGGFGTVRAGLAAGVPLAVLPLFADQPHNAERVHALGAGLDVRDPARWERRADAAGGPGLRGASRRRRGRVRALPPVEEAARILRELAAARSDAPAEAARRAPRAGPRRHAAICRRLDH